ncbi:MAG TPA: mechanosensitive ion channel family protein, partial [Phormidium sp.]
MAVQVSAAWEKVQRMINGFIALMPNMVLALIVFAIFFMVAGAIRRLVQKLTRNRQHAHNLWLIPRRLAQWTTVLIGLIIALSIVISPLKAGDLVQLV